MRIRPVINHLKNFKATNYESPIHLVKDISTKEHKQLQKSIKHFVNYPRVATSWLDGKQFVTSNQGHCQISPLYHHPVVSKFNMSHTQPIYDAIQNHQKAKKQWLEIPIEKRMEIMLKISELIKTKYYYEMLAATIVGQGKSIHEANIDAIQELVDFLNFNVDFSLQILKKQPISTDRVTNISLYQPLEGIVASYTPFNFTAIAGNLATAPLIWGNSVFWKPSDKSMLSNYLFYEICLEAGVHDNILNFVITPPSHFTDIITSDNQLGAVLFTGSTFGYNSVLTKIHENYYKNVFYTPKEYNYTRCIGETGGQNFHFVDTDANLDLVVEKTFNSAFGYSGQKCSACSRLYLPETMWEEFIEKMKGKILGIDEQNYSVISEYAYKNLDVFIKEMKNKALVEVIQPKQNNRDTTYFISPTGVLCHTPHERVLREEFFGPILGVRLYQPENKNKMIEECKQSVPYALTGAIFSDNKEFLEQSVSIFRESCGNMYLNDQSTGAVVGQQPFGGFKASGTNDKAGDSNFMLRLCNQQNIKINNN